MNPTIRFIHSSLDPVYGVGEVNAMIRIIFEYLKGWNATDLVIRANEPLSDFIKSEVRKIVARLLKYEPIQYIVGQADFYGLKIKVAPGVLIPRPETAELIDIITDENTAPDLRVLDACTGSGCIAVALSRNLKFPEITAIDISPRAIAVAKENASDLKCDIRFIQTDIFSWNPVGESFDIIVSNPPYVDESEKKEMDKNVLEYEPMQAIFVPDSDPLKFYRRIAEIAEVSLTPSGRIYLEINPLHCDSLADLLHDRGFGNVTVEKDIHGRNRFIIASR